MSVEIAINEYRGVRKVCGADVTEDVNGYVGGVWRRLFGAQGVTVTPNESSETHYYDNRAAIQIDTEGAIDVAMTVSIPELKTKAWLDGKTITAKGMYVGTPKKGGYKAVCFIGEKDDGTEELNIFYKGKFTGGETTHNTKDDGTEGTNTTYNFGSIFTANNIAKDQDAVTGVNFFNSCQNARGIGTDLAIVQPAGGPNAIEPLSHLRSQIHHTFRNFPAVRYDHNTDHSLILSESPAELPAS